MLPPSSCARSRFLFEQEGHHVRLSVSYLLNRRSKLLTLYLLWGFLNSHEPRLPWNPALLEHLHPVMRRWDAYGKETSTYTPSLTLLLVGSCDVSLNFTYGIQGQNFKSMTARAGPWVDRSDNHETSPARHLGREELLGPTPHSKGGGYTRKRDPGRRGHEGPCQMLPIPLIPFPSFDLLLSPLWSTVTCVLTTFTVVLDGGLLKDRCPPRYASWHTSVVCDVRPRVSAANVRMEWVHGWMNKWCGSWLICRWVAFVKNDQ